MEQQRFPRPADPGGGTDQQTTRPGQAKPCPPRTVLAGPGRAMTRMTAAELAAALSSKPGKYPRLRLPRRTWAEIEAAGSQLRSLPARGGGQRPGRRPRGGRAPRGRGGARSRWPGVPAGPQGRVHHHGHAHHPASSAPFLDGWQPPSRRDRDQAAPRGQAWCCWSKTNMDWRVSTMGSSTENSAFGTSRNPWERCAGARWLVEAALSSAVAGFEAPLGIGTEHWRDPPASPPPVCGIVGVKPTYGSSIPVRADRLHLVAGHSRAAGPDRAGCGPAARGDLWP